MKAICFAFIAAGITAGIAAGITALGFIAANSKAPTNSVPAALEPAAPKPGSPEQLGSPEDLAALRSDIQLLRADLRELQDRVGNAGETESAILALEREVAALGDQLAAVLQDAAPGGPPQSVEEDLAFFEDEAAYQEEDRRRQLDDHFEAQSADTLWSLDAAELVGEVALRQELAGSSVHAVECRSSLCRVEVSHDDDDAANEFVLRFPMEVGEALPQMQIFSELQDDGRIIATLYLSREGYALPVETP